MGDTAAALYDRAVEAGLGELDYSAVYRAVVEPASAVDDDAS